MATNRTTLKHLIDEVAAQFGGGPNAAFDIEETLSAIVSRKGLDTGRVLVSIREGNTVKLEVASTTGYVDIRDMASPAGGNALLPDVVLAMDDDAHLPQALRRAQEDW